jgi:acetyl esterase/lipase
MRNALRSQLLALAWLTATGLVLGQAPPGKPTLPLFDHPVGKEFLFADFARPPFKVQYPAHVEATFDLTYAAVTGARPLLLDIYRVLNAGPKPAIVFVHGGSYVGGNPRDDRSPVFGEDDGFMAYVASRGYVVVPVRYRLADEAKWPAQLEDVKAAIRWVRANAEQYGVDAQHIGVWGESAGGHIAAMVGSTCGVQEFERQENNGIYGNNPPPTVQDKAASQSSCVQAAVVWSGTTDFSQLDAQKESFTRLVHNSPTSSQSRVLGCSLGSTCDTATVQKASALNYVAQGGAANTAFLLQAGAHDEATPWQQSQILYDALRAKGITAQIDLIPGANHYFIGATRDQAKEILDTFFKFLDNNLSKPANKKP